MGIPSANRIFVLQIDRLSTCGVIRKKVDTGQYDHDHNVCNFKVVVAVTLKNNF